MHLAVETTPHMTDWLTLAPRITAWAYQCYFCDEAALAAAETTLGVALPDDYKAYCQLFGAGDFAGYRIFAPCDEPSYDLLGTGTTFLQEYRLLVEDEIEKHHNDFVGALDLDVLEQLYRLLRHAVPLGVYSGWNLLVWDATTPGDIFVLPYHCLDKAQLLSRSFVEFVQGFMLTKRLEKMVECG